jgi:hypothetical protein
VSVTSITQGAVDKFYLSRGKKPCCAGCDWWRFYNSTTGECTKSAPVAGSERWSLVGLVNISGNSPPGHIMTNRDYSCGDFIDTFDWSKRGV